MKRILSFVFILVTSMSYSQQLTKECKRGYSQELIVENQSNIPEIENFKGDFQIELSSQNLEGRSIALSTEFYDFVEVNRSISEEVRIEMGNSNTLVIAPNSSLNENGQGPFTQPFVQK